MRAWLVLKAAGVAFDTAQIPLDRADSRVNIPRHSPSVKVSALILRDCVVSDSLAIAEMIAESFPRGGLWPGDPVLRAIARSASRRNALRVRKPARALVKETLDH